jgi:cyanophycinase
MCDARSVSSSSGTLALLGGGDVDDPSIAQALLARAPGPRVAVIPTAAAFEHPEEVVVRVAEWLIPHGAHVEALMATSRSDADLEDLADRLADADMAYLTDGAALHLRTALRSTALLEGLRAMLGRGGLVAASGGSATALCDPMIDPRGGAPTVGLGLVEDFALITHAADDDPRSEKLHRSIALCPATLAVVALGAGSGLFVGPGDRFEAFGRGQPAVYRAGELLDGGVDAL